jgi:hypothetical protein
MVRNVGMHLSSPRPAWNRKVDKYVRRAHGWLGFGPADPHTTWLGIPFTVEYRPRQEDVATAPVHTVLLLAALAALLPTALRERSWAMYLLAAVGGFAAFCVVFKWQPWHPRLHLPCFALGGVGFAWLMTRPRSRCLMPVAAIALVASVVPVALGSSARSLGLDGPNVFSSSADELRFFDRGDVLADAKEVVERIRVKHAGNVELINQEPVPWEYPIALWLQQGEHPPRVGYFYPVADASKHETPIADMVVDMGSDHPPEWIVHPRTRAVFRIESRIGRFTLYELVKNYAGPPVADQPVARFGIEKPD